MPRLGSVRSKKGLFVAAGVLAAFLFTLGARYREVRAERQSFAAAKLTPSAPPPRAPALVRGEVVSWQPRANLSGTLLPIREATLNFKVAGRLAALRVKVGDRVKAGQKLAELDSAEARAAHNAALAQVHAAQVRLAIADENEQRTRGLLAQGAISGTQHAADRQRVDAARAELEAARAQAETAAVALANTQLLAPFPGCVTVAPSAAGAIVMPGATLFRIEDTSALRLSATISVVDAAFAQPGAEVELEGGQRGRVSAVLPSVDAQTRRLPIVAELDNSGPRPLLAGVFVRATLAPGAPIRALKLPPSALRPGSQDELVLVTGERLTIARVVLARASDGSLLVREGLAAEDQVLAAPSAEVKDGDAAPAALAEASR
jgi:RND family efflux transporter MFP subunit